MRRRIAVLGLVAAQTVLGLVVTGTGVAQAAPVDQSPLARAKATGQRVELPGRTTATGQAFVNPDGTTTMEQHVVPVRGRKDGKWAPIDTSLRFSGSGVVQAAGAVETSFSPGGSGAMVRIAEGDKYVEMTWPRPLPKPELAKDTALYRDVLPGVDLKLRAVPQGFAKVLVVKDRRAAGNPELAKLSFGIRSGGVSVRRTSESTVEAADASGGVVFRAGQARMWDSGTAKKRSAVPVELAGDRIAVVPDQSLLTAPDTTYPVEIDPDWSAGRAAWAMVYGVPDRFRSQAYWFGDGDNIAKVGYSAWESPVVQARSFFQFDTAGLIGKNILGAEFNALETYAPSCKAKPVILNETGAIHPGTTWINQPWIGQQLGSHNVAAGYDASCPAKWLGFDVVKAVRNSANPLGPSNTTTVALIAADEGPGASLWWKKFDPNNVKLSVTYNTVPNAPLYKTTDGKECKVVPNQSYITRTGPTLKAIPTDPDGGGVKVEFEWYVKNGAHKGGTTTLSQSSGSTFGVTIPATAFKNGETISWRARTTDTIDTSAWSNWCDATIDTDRPAKPPLVSSPDFPRDGVGGGLGQTGRFLLEPNGVTDVVAYEYDLHDQPQRRVEAGPDGKATALVTPPDDTYYDLYVRSVDRAGNISDRSEPYHFRPGAGTPPVNAWRLNGYYGDLNAFDSSGNGNHGKLSASGASWTTGRQDDAVVFNGSGYVATTKPAVRTDATFTVAAWVRTDATPTGWQAVVSQDGPQVSGFFLEMDPATRKWVFALPSTQAPDSPRRFAEADRPVVVGRWTHLVGVFDQATGTVSLYVDGVKQARTGVQTTPWNATGGVQIGRLWYASRYTDLFHGAVDEVRFYSRMLSEKEVHALATAPTTGEGAWTLDGGGKDFSGNNRVAAPAGGVTWSPVAAVGTGSVALDGTSGYLDTQQQAVRTDNSFTVSAYARITGDTGDWQTVVSQDGPKASGFSLRYRSDTKRWSFGVSTADADLPATVAADSAQEAAVGEWTQLTGVYDEAKRQIRLYVNSAISASTPIPPDKRFTHVPGSLVIGRAKLAGKPGRFLKGSVDHVTAYTGVRTEDQIKEDARTPPLPHPTVYSGQFTRWVANGGEHTFTLGEPVRGARFEAGLGFPAEQGAPDTRMLYSCLSGADEFPSTDPACEQKRVNGEIGLVYTVPPANVATTPIHRCKVTRNGERFASRHADCEGQTNEGLLGHAKAYQYLTRYRDIDGLGERRSGAHRVPASYRPDISLGVIATGHLPGTVGLRVCQDGTDTFLSVQDDCEGKQHVEWTGAIWSSPPPDAESAQLLRCRVTGAGELFESLDPGCEGQAIDRSLGYVLVRP
ncbi:LamG domain-containing protein [Kibdelosporangium phytohabitans]|uniref:LamG-like jellyroll fold domain-containing protein n=1 Tax=Kibdelosporangium phytohabitans TaxID=860235 RepID=A0A0N9I1N5_9PSEU|nr:LamG domain-containing protein [Kibdelosporangium phytohabitans]ALG09752.1 hypothetical protein AOZ06_25170 [Kibdelosporangium phytohabitans]MBE1468879.1 hypothetical protein [Kibdelosporangium phytohabitans]